MPQDEHTVDPPPPFTSEPASGSAVIRLPPEWIPTSSESHAPMDPLPPAYVPEIPEDPLSLVPHDSLVNHLRLLSHFAALRSRVQTTCSGMLSHLSPATRWSAFLRLATYQLEVWLSRVCARDGSHGAGSNWERSVAALPLDAAFVMWAWFSGAAGGTRAFEEDVRRCWAKELRYKEPGRDGQWTLRDFPVVDLVDRLEGRISTLVALRGRQLWDTQTGHAAWDSVEMLQDEQARMWVECPWCGEGCEQPLITLDGTGYCEESFSARCPVINCGQRITFETLGISRLLEDCLGSCSLPQAWLPPWETRTQGWEKKRRAEEDAVAQKLVAGTLSVSTLVLASTRVVSSRELVSAALTTCDIQRVLRPFAGPEGRLTESVDTLEKVERLLRDDGALPSCIIRHVLSAHTTPHPFAADIARNAARLTGLLDALASAAWLAPDFPHTETGRQVLGKASTRYELFLTLATKIVKEGPAIVTLDIDFVWITHLLCASRYRSNVVDQAEIFLDRAPAVEESVAAAQFDSLAKLWEETLRIPFSFVHRAPPSRNPLKRLLRPTPTALTSGSSGFDWSLAMHPLPESTAPNACCSVLVHTQQQAVRRRKRREGESGAFLRGSSAVSAARPAGLTTQDDVWFVREEDARRVGNGILGVDGYLPPSVLHGFVHAQTYTPFRESTLPRTREEAGQELRARQATAVVRMFPGR